MGEAAFYFIEHGKNMFFRGALSPNYRLLAPNPPNLKFELRWEVANHASMLT
jgi:hypothetical protein